MKNVCFFKSKSIYLNKSLDTQVPKDTDARPTKENNRTSNISSPWVPCTLHVLPFLPARQGPHGWTSHSYNACMPSPEMHIVMNNSAKLKTTLKTY